MSHSSFPKFSETAKTSEDEGWIEIILHGERKTRPAQRRRSGLHSSSVTSTPPLPPLSGNKKEDKSGTNPFQKQLAETEVYGKSTDKLMYLMDLLTAFPHVDITSVLSLFSKNGCTSWSWSGDGGIVGFAMLLMQYYM